MFLANEMGMVNPVLSEISAAFIRSWLVDLKEKKKNSAKSINRKISSLKSFFKYHLRQGNLVKTP
ncbi:site-specific integrase [Paraflavitalea speifideaquila]|uniref:site-specific integrase n=1 Tax=Paraflavitalea speifideaquila TaxID=3076558 RepID=UPI0028F1202D|nr:site-specific integrase [Paraflavitalea speifideiaquila]